MGLPVLEPQRRRQAQLDIAVGGGSGSAVGTIRCDSPMTPSVERMCSCMPTDGWGDLPFLLTVEEAARVLRVGRSLAYDQTTLYFKSGGVQGIPVIRLGGVLRVPKAALHELMTTGRIVQLLEPTTERTEQPVNPARVRRSTDRLQLSLLTSD